MRKNADEESMLLPLHSFGHTAFCAEKAHWHIGAWAVRSAFVLSVCVNIFSKKKLSATLAGDGTGLKNKDMSLKIIFTGSGGEYSGKLRLRNMLTGQCEDIKVHFIISREPACGYHCKKATPAER